MKTYRCYDCGSIHPEHHTPLCEMCGPDAKRDLNPMGNTQWWNGWCHDHILEDVLKHYGLKYSISELKMLSLKKVDEVFEELDLKVQNVRFNKGTFEWQITDNSRNL